MKENIRKPRKGILCRHCKIENLEYFNNPDFIECAGCHQNKSRAYKKEEKLPVI